MSNFVKLVTGRPSETFLKSWIDDNQVYGICHQRKWKSEPKFGYNWDKDNKT